eukprot:11205633-Lingulodinium_polyedra.AAC.1
MPTDRQRKIVHTDAQRAPELHAEPPLLQLARVLNDIRLDELGRHTASCRYAFNGMSNCPGSSQ